MIAVAFLFAAGCDNRQGPPAPAASAEPAAASVPVVPPEWLGRWTGPEGSWLEITRTGDTYTVTVMNLDGARSFPGIVDAGGVSFERDGVRETIRPSDGSGTGMKWLADKKDCLVV